MLRQRITFTVGRSATEVFAFVARDFFTNHRRWDPGITELTQTSSGPVGIGTTGREVRSFGGRQAADFVVTEFEPDRRFAFRNTSGAFALDRSYTFTPTAAGTEVRFSFDMNPRTLPVRLLWPLLRRLIARQVAQNITRLEWLLSRSEAETREGDPAPSLP